MTAQLDARCERVRILLATRNDYMAPLRGSSPVTEPGPAGSRYVPCSDCKGSGKRKRGLLGSNVCGSCDGRGERKRTRNEPEVDMYLGSTVQDASVRPQEARTRVRSGSEGETLTEPWERLRTARDTAGSYNELERVLSQAPDVYRWAITWRYDHDYPVPDRLEHAAVVWIARRMEGHIRVPKRFHRELMLKRRERIRQLAMQGLSHAEIREEIGVGLREIRRTLEAA